AGAAAAHAGRVADVRRAEAADLGRGGRRAGEGADHRHGAALQRPVRGTLHPRLRPLGAAGAARAGEPLAPRVPRPGAAGPVRVMENVRLARVFRDLAAYLEMDGIQFKPRAYEKAAPAIGSQDRPLVALPRQRGPTT